MRRRVTTVATSHCKAFSIQTPILCLNALILRAGSCGWRSADGQPSGSGSAGSDASGAVRDVLPRLTTAPAIIKRIHRGTTSLLTGGLSSQSTLSDQTPIKGHIQQPWHSASNTSLSCLSEKRPKRYAKKLG